MTFNEIHDLNREVMEIAVRDIERLFDFLENLWKELKSSFR